MLEGNIMKMIIKYLEINFNKKSIVEYLKIHFDKL